jgi:hypothetical protein
MNLTTPTCNAEVEAAGAEPALAIITVDGLRGVPSTPVAAARPDVH